MDAVVQSFLKMLFVKMCVWIQVGSTEGRDLKVSCSQDELLNIGIRYQMTIKTAFHHMQEALRKHKRGVAGGTPGYAKEGTKQTTATQPFCS